jgi:hypothetical protein
MYFWFRDRHLVCPVSDDVGKSSTSDAHNWKLLLAYEGFEFSVRYQFSDWLLRSFFNNFQLCRRHIDLWY